MTAYNKYKIDKRPDPLDSDWMKEVSKESNVVKTIFRKGRSSWVEYLRKKINRDRHEHVGSEPTNK